MKYELFQSNELIFREGDKSNDKMYICVSGQVAIALHKNKNIFREQDEDQNHQKSQQSDGSQTGTHKAKRQGT